MIRPLIWLIRRLGPEALVSLTLLLAAIASVALGLADAIRGLDAGVLLPMAVLGLLIGWGLARSPLPGWLGGTAALALGIEIIFLRVGRLGKPLMALLWALVASSINLVEFLLWEGWRLAQPGGQLSALTDVMPILLALEDLWVDVSTLLVREFSWLWAAVMGRPTFDLVAAALTWGILLWAVSAWASWWVRRRDQPLLGMVPAGVLVGGTLFLTSGNSVFLVAYLAGTLLLMVSIEQDTRERRWTTAGTDFPFDVGLETKAVGAGLSLILVTMAALAPSISVHEMIDWAGRLVRGHPDRVQIVAGPTGRQANDPSPETVLDEDRIRSPGLPRRHLIGSGPELSEQVVMVIYPKEHDHTDSKLTPSPLRHGSDDSTQPYYWRSLTYNVYTGRGWVTDGTQMLEYRAGDLAVYADAFEPLGMNYQAASMVPPGRRKVSAEVRTVTGLGELLHAAGDLVTVDHDYRVAWRSAEDAFGAILSSVDQALAPVATDLPVGASEPERFTRTGDSGTEDTGGAVIAYWFDSLVPAVGEAQLRAAGTDYPAWVQDRYLALPADVPSRVLALARDLTATEPTPYDRALAIETYLRTFPYNLDLPSPKVDRDVVDFFLFDLKQGYCDYYATSMVVLARAAGVPARLAVGYHTGTYDEINHRYVVTEADAHAWVEIFFPGYGWIEFEPTAGVPPIRRLADVPPVVPTELDVLSPGGVERVVAGRLWWLGLPGVVVFLGLGVIIWLIADSWRLRLLSPETTITALYGRLYRHGQRLAVPTRAGETPFEYAASLAERVEELAEKGAWATIFTPLAQEAHWLVSLYVRIRYSPHYADGVYQQQAIRAWRRMYWRLLLAQTYRGWSSIVRFSLASSRSARHPAS